MLEGYSSIGGRYEGLPVTDPKGNKDLTIKQRIMVAAATLNPANRAVPFKTSHIVVRAWECYPTVFGLEGYLTEYPDSNKVLCPIMGDRGLVTRGYLLKTMNKTYCLTKLALMEVDRLTRNTDVEPVVPGVRLAQPDQKFFLNLTTSVVVTKFNKNKADISFSDACRFWMLPESRLTRDGIADQLTSYDKKFIKMEEDLALKDGELSNGQTVTAGDIRALRNTHEYLKSRFERLLSLVGKRK